MARERLRILFSALLNIYIRNGALTDANIQQWTVGSLLLPRDVEDLRFQGISQDCP